MDPIFELITVHDCPCCGGSAYLSEEGGWAFTVECAECGAHTAVATYKNPEDRQRAAEQAAYTWNLGKVINPAPGE